MNAITKFEQDLSNITTLLDEYNSNDKAIEKLNKELKEQSSSIKEAITRNNKNILGIKYDKLTRVEIVELIAKVDKKLKQKICKTNDFVCHVNGYVRVLTQIVNDLMAFHNTSYEDLKKCVNTVDDISKLVDEKIDKTDILSGQVNTLLKGQLQRVYNEGQLKERVDLLESYIRYLKKQNDEIKSQLKAITGIEITSNEDCFEPAISANDGCDLKNNKKYEIHIILLWVLTVTNLGIVVYMILSHIL